MDFSNSIMVFYSNDGGVDFGFEGQVSAENNEFTFTIPEGVTDSAQIRLVAVDTDANQGEGVSDYFSITDNTPPLVEINDPGDIHIADEISIQWSASDNTGLGYHKIYFSL